MKRDAVSMHRTIFSNNIQGFAVKRSSLDRSSSFSARFSTQASEKFGVRVIDIEKQLMNSEKNSHPVDLLLYLAGLFLREFFRGFHAVQSDQPMLHMSSRN